MSNPHEAKKALVLQLAKDNAEKSASIAQLYGRALEPVDLLTIKVGLLIEAMLGKDGDERVEFEHEWQLFIKRNLERLESSSIQETLLRKGGTN